MTGDVRCEIPACGWSGEKLPSNSGSEWKDLLGSAKQLYGVLWPQGGAAR